MYEFVNCDLVNWWTLFVSRVGGGTGACPALVPPLPDELNPYFCRVPQELVNFLLVSLNCMSADEQHISTSLVYYLKVSPRTPNGPQWTLNRPAGKLATNGNRWQQTTTKIWVYELRSMLAQVETIIVTASFSSNFQNVILDKGLYSQVAIY